MADKQSKTPSIPRNGKASDRDPASGATRQAPPGAGDPAGNPDGAMPIGGRGFTRIGTLFLALAGIWGIFILSTGGLFATPRNLSNLFRQTAVLAFVAMGLQFVILAGKIDFTVGFLAGFVSLFATANQGLLLGRVLPALFAGSGASPALLGIAATGITIFCCLALGFLFGLYQGWLIGVRKLPSLIVSFANSFLLAGLLPVAMLGGASGGIHASFVFIGQGYLSRAAGWAVGAAFLAAFGAMRIRDRNRKAGYGLTPVPRRVEALRFAAAAVLVIGFIAYVADGYRGLPVPVLLLLAATGFLSYLLTGTRFGIRCVAVGCNPSVASFSGVNVKKQIVLTYALSGVMAGIGGIVLTGYMSYGTLGDTTTLTYSALAACLIGLIGLGKDRGAVVGAAIGALLLASLDNWMVLTDMAPFLKEVIRGMLLISVAYAATKKGRGFRPIVNY